MSNSNNGTAFLINSDNEKYVYETRHDVDWPAIIANVQATGKEFAIIRLSTCGDGETQFALLADLSRLSAWSVNGPSRRYDLPAQWRIRFGKQADLEGFYNTIESAREYKREEQMSCTVTVTSLSL